MSFLYDLSPLSSPFYKHPCLPYLSLYYVPLALSIAAKGREPGRTWPYPSLFLEALARLVD